jgi:predicted YcjX-like family ATPase
VMQTIRFEPDRYVRLVGLTRVEQRDQNLPRFRTMIDGVDMNP